MMGEQAVVQVEGGSAPAIEVKEVVKSYGSVMALDGVSFCVGRGELFFLLGPSGCGKTTMLRILAGLETTESGSVLFAGRDVSDLPPHRRSAPMVFQNYALWPHLTVRDNVAFGLVERKVARGETEERVNRTLARVGLADCAGRTPAQLSGGQQQRVVLARALVLDPAVMLLDEPLSNLDAKLRADMRDEIAALHRDSDITFVYVTHDQAEALSLADRLVVMDSGCICATGTPRELYHRPPNRFCADFLGDSNLIPCSVIGTENEFVAVKTAFGVWHAVLTDRQLRVSVGDHVTCLVRPEHFRPADAVGDSAGPGMAGPEWNRASAEVCFVRLSGATVSIGLCAQDIELKATLLSRHEIGVAPGARGVWEVDPVNTIVLAD